MHAALLFLLLASAAPPDTLVVCPDEFRAALSSWQELREGQGHRIRFIAPPATADQLQSIIRRTKASGQLKYLVLIGDVLDHRDGPSNEHRSIPTNYVRAKVNVHWHSTPTIATDLPYADVDGDGLPDLAVGRIPADTPAELAAVMRKLVRYEQPAECLESPRRLHVVAGVGGFGAWTDALIEAAARQVFLQTVPREYRVELLSANPASPACPPPGEFAQRARQQLCEQSLAWIYLGHAWPTELDCVHSQETRQPILSVADVPRIRCQSQGPLAVLIACYTGAIDSQPDCLAEELLLAEEGPIAVVAATRVTMPYGNAVLGYELLRACFTDRPAGMGDIIRLAQQRTLAESTSDSLRASLDMLAQGLSPPPLDLVAERLEHVQMYHLLGDPLTRLRITPPTAQPMIVATRNALIQTTKATKDTK